VNQSAVNRTGRDLIDYVKPYVDSNYGGGS
jgi:hypothetical protein